MSILSKKGPLLGALLLVGCGVEAGNPGDKSEGGGTKKGTLSILVAKEPKSGFEQLTLGLDELQLLNQEGVQGTEVLMPKLRELNLFAEQDKVDDSSQEITSSEVPVGDYHQVLFKLTQDLPAQYADREGKKRKVRWEDPATTGFSVIASFSVKEAEKTEILLSLNLYQSLQIGDGDDGVLFKPRGDAKKRGLGQKISGPAPEQGIQWVCAYLYQPKMKLRPQGEYQIADLDFSYLLQPKQPHGPRMEDRMVYATKDQISFDKDYPCKNAFEQAPVRNDEYRLRPVPPGSYAIRFFKADKTYIDLKQDIDIPAF